MHYNYYKNNTVQLLLEVYLYLQDISEENDERTQYITIPDPEDPNSLIDYRHCKTINSHNDVM